MTKRRPLFRRLLRNRSGLAMMEFALAAPLLMTAGLWGTEVAWMALTNLKISQTAMHIADNASRIGNTTLQEEKKVYETDINEIFVGANIHAGRQTDLFEHGRVILSSQELVPGSKDKQYIHWQRCLGKLHQDSSYGEEGDGLTSKFEGMGPKDKEVEAYDDADAVMFVEIAYEYQPLFSDMFVGDTMIRAYGAFSVRENRDLTQIYQKDSANPVPVASCDEYTGLQ